MTAQGTWLTARPIAHRGLHDRAVGTPENTLSSIAAAVERGFAVEIDVRLSGDGEVVVFHDATLERMTGRQGRVDGLTWAQLGALPILGGPEHIPMLADVLVQVGGRTPIFIELKVEEEDAAMPLARAVAALLAHSRGRFAVMSFHPGVLRRFRKLAPDIPLGLLSSHFSDAGSRAEMSLARRIARRHLLPAAYVLPNFIAYDVHDLPSLAPTVLRRLFGLPLIAWTVCTEAERMVAQRHAEQMIFEGFDPHAVPSPARTL